LKLSKRSKIAIALLICTMIGSVYAESQWHLISDIWQGETTVTNSLLHIYPCGDTPFPSSKKVGEQFKILIDVDNPNPATVGGRFMINFTASGIASNDVSVTSDATYNPPNNFPVYVTKEGVFGSTLVFTIKVNAADQNFYFNPGSNLDVTYIFITYNKAGTYQYALAAIQ